MSLLNRPLNRVLLALLVCVLGVRLAFQVSSKEIDNGTLCREVDHELNAAVREGILNPEDASAISQRCYQRK